MTDKQRHRRPLGVAIAGLYTILVTGLSLLPASSVELRQDFIPHLDKIAHFLMYGGYVLTLTLARHLWGLSDTRHLVRFIFTTVVLTSCYGVFMEFMQSWVRPGDRAFSYGDMAANALGSLAFAVLIVHNLPTLEHIVNRLQRSIS